MKLFAFPTANVDGITSFRVADYLYLESSGRKRASEIRSVLEQWFSNYPEGSNKRDVRSRFTDMTQAQHYSAFFELLLHELMLSLGFTIQLPNTENGAVAAPDFELKTPATKQSIHLEATVRLEIPTLLRTDDGRVRDAMDALNQIASPDFFFIINQNGAPKQDGVRKAVMRAIEVFINKYNYENVVADFAQNGYKGLPSLRFDYYGWYLELLLYPKNEARGKPDIAPLIGWNPALPLLSVREALWSALKDKANKYKTVTTPYVIAINLPPTAFPWTEASQALSGTYASDGALFPDGAWHAKNPQTGSLFFRRVSGLLLFHSANPWNIGAETEWEFFRNPNAEHPIPEEFAERLPEYQEGTPQFSVMPSKRIDQIIRSIPERWSEY